MDLSLAGKKALVCGSSQGIGRAAAAELASLGATVTLMARDEDRLRLAAADLPRPLGGDAQPHSYLIADFSKPDQVRQAVHAAADPASPYHILVNNTGGPPGGPIADATAEQFLSAFTAHLLCNQALVQVLIPGMKAARYGRIINIISTSVKVPIPGLGVSNTIRGAVASWAKTLAGELGPHGITVNNVLPGFTSTDRLASLIKTRAQKSGESEESVAKGMIVTIPAGRFGEASEVGAAIAFLATPAAAYINGINLPVDGGRLGTL
jgi:3-oxoacyl-[acyl-carrier protein] reductase